MDLLLTLMDACMFITREEVFKMTRDIDITFKNEAYQSFSEVETDCTEAQISAFADVCGTILGGAVSEISISDIRTLKFGSDEV